MMASDFISLSQGGHTPEPTERKRGHQCWMLIAVCRPLLLPSSEALTTHPVGSHERQAGGLGHVPPLQHEHGGLHVPQALALEGFAP